MKELMIGSDTMSLYRKINEIIDWINIHEKNQKEAWEILKSGVLEIKRETK